MRKPLSEQDEHRFKAMEEVILSGQMPAERVPTFLRDNPDFALWYRKRMQDRNVES